ncbi:Uncharacterised protein [uncultured archaeon]|nr:Uncharacterised protein [uncultured archaeon]
MVSWKTTVAGIIAGAIPILQTISGSLQVGGHINWYQIAFGLAIMVLGVFAKDIGVPPAALAIIFTLSILSPLTVACSSGIKNTIGATCPANAVCDQVDFGYGVFTACLSPSDMPKLQAAAAQSRARITQEDAGK